ncbi:MAG: thioredoxin family protein [Flavobacteriaceae bacterium]|nr:thioredoxin family protein [Flavobacteriaceae bacterium]
MKRIKTIGLLVALLLSSGAFAQKKGYDLNWQSDFEQAKTMAKTQNKLILIYFTSSDASTASKRLNEDFFYTEKFKELSEKHLILLRVNMPRRSNLISEFQKTSNQELSVQYGQKVIPTVVLCDANGKDLGMIESYNYLHDTSKHYALINKALKKN